MTIHTTFVSIVIASALTACAMPDTPAETLSSDELATAPHIAVCREAAPGEAQCTTHALADVYGDIRSNTLPAGYGPSDLRSAYKVTGLGSAASTIAVVTALGYPNAEADLAMYRSTYGLPACTSTSGCFRKVNQTGATSPLPALNLGWAQTAAVGLDMASALCPSCKLVLVEATSASFANFATAENTAAGLAHTVSNAWGGSEAGSTSFEPAFNHAGIAIVAPAGDPGFGAAQFPASSPHVTAVGATSLKPALATLRGWTETAIGAQGACSTLYAKPAWQHDAFCPTHRTAIDVAAVGDASTGVAVYAPMSATTSAFAVFGGTAVSASIIAGVYGVANDTINAASKAYATPSGIFDITTGAGAAVGYDLATGVGTPNGVSAF